MPDTSKMYFYIFNLESVKQFQRAKKIEKIKDSSLIKEHILQLNKVEELLDTIIVD